MIIKKKYTIPNKIINENSSGEEEIQKSAAHKEEEAETKIVEQEKNVIQEKEQEQPEIKPVKNDETKEKKKKKDINDLNLSLENIKFEPREERREGTRRRGYRRTQDRNLVSRAQKDALNIKEAAKQEGYNDGISAAKEDLENLKSKLEEFFNYKDEVYEKLSGCIIDISVEIARKIINKEVDTDKTYIVPLIKNVLEDVNKTENKIVLKVMPKDVEILRDKVSDIFSGNNFEAKISVVPDNEIKDGGVIVETSNGIIDASIETQLAIIEKALKKLEETQEN